MMPTFFHGHKALHSQYVNWETCKLFAELLGQVMNALNLSAGTLLIWDHSQWQLECCGLGTTLCVGRSRSQSTESSDPRSGVQEGDLQRREIRL